MKEYAIQIGDWVHVCCKTLEVEDPDPLSGEVVELTNGWIQIAHKLEDGQEINTCLIPMSNITEIGKSTKI